MKKVKISIFVFVLLLLVFDALAAKINSTSYKQSVIVSFGGENVTSASYKMNVAIGIINRVINSTSFINRLGFFHTILLADEQPCTSAGQCEGGFCCSNLCKSSSCPVPSGGGGGGGEAGSPGGGGVIVEKIEEPIKDFSVSPASIKEQLALGNETIRAISIKNTGNVMLSFNLNVITVGDFVSLSENSFSLEPAREKSITAKIIGKRLGSYFGGMEIAGDGIKKSVDIVIEVESEQVLFDVKIDIPPAYQEIEAGGELKAQITLLNVGPPRKVDVTTTYIIKDRAGNVVYEASETFAVENQKSFVKSFNVPKNLRPGDYLAIIEVRYENSFAVSSELFRVVPKESAVETTLKSNTTLIFIFGVFIGLMFLFIYLLIPRIRKS